MSKSDENDVFLSLDDDDSKPVETKVKKTKEKPRKKPNLSNRKILI